MMCRTVSLTLMALMMSWTALGSHVAAHQATPTDPVTAIRGTITATGRFIFTWFSSNDPCTLAFWDYDFTPDLIVTDDTGRELASLPLGNLPGTVTLAGPAGAQRAEVCTVPYELPIPASDTYRVILDP